MKNLNEEQSGEVIVQFRNLVNLLAEAYPSLYQVRLTYLTDSHENAHEEVWVVANNDNFDSVSLRITEWDAR